ncbi:hypothetical protein, partial [Streptomyces sp. NPDC098090]|uniref:hypothetical protein n=1 Tax=Streptomyces sp. NPDC098090 TaxID=3366095 RepID=UPI00382919E3
LANLKQLGWMVHPTHRRLLPRNPSDLGFLTFAIYELHQDVRVVDADLVPGLAALEPEQGVHPDRDGDALHVVGERLEAVVEQVLLLARQDDVQPREGLGAGVAVALPERERVADRAAGAFPDAVPGVALVVPDLLGEPGLGRVPLSSLKRRTTLVLVGWARTSSVLKLRPVSLMAWLTSTCQSVRCLRPP